MADELDEVEKLSCPHVRITGNLHIEGMVNNAQDVEGYCAEVKVWCDDCGERMVWMGPDAGHFSDRPGVDIEKVTLFAPCRPESSDPEFGSHVPSVGIVNRIQTAIRERSTLQLELAGVIANPSLVTPRVGREAAEAWAARAVVTWLEQRSV